MRAAAVLLLLGLWLGCADDAPPHPIVGAWEDIRWSDSTDVFERTYAFETDGGLTISMRRPLDTDTAFALTYTIEYDSVLTLNHEGNVEQLIARIAGDTLVLRTPEHSSTFVRVNE